MATALNGATVLVLGLGESGLAMARWCARGGAAVRVWDSRLDAAATPPPPNAAALARHVPSAVAFGGPLTGAAFDGVSRVLKSPGLAPADPRIAAALAAAAARGLPVHGELALFADALAGLRADRGYTPKVVAITGTNGKTTTTAMAARLIERSGLRVAMAGNIGPTMLQTLADALDAAAAAAVDGPSSPPTPALLPEAWVLELSSFQLDGADDGFEPDAAALLNLTEDHLDWHGSMAAYAAAKARVFGRRAVRVVNRDDAAVGRLLADRQPVVEVDPSNRRRRSAVAEAVAAPPVVWFGLGAPRRAGDWGLVEDNGIAWLARALPADEPPSSRSRRSGAAAPVDEPLAIQRLMPADALRVRGRHNAANALAALALASAIGCRTAPLLHALRDYAGEPHRVQHVATIGGVDVFDDSKGTNVGATVAALDGLGADRSMTRLVVILGGDGKGQDFTPLAAPVRRHVRAVATIGRDAAAIEAALADSGVPLVRHADLPAATRWAFAQAEAGDAVLLSPACASLDMFRHYGHRAEVFVAEVLALAAERGEVAT